MQVVHGIRRLVKLSQLRWCKNMARLSTKYDSDLKEQVLVLRGDEGYTRSTKTLLELGNPSIQTDYFDLPVTVNVLRDKDKGTILLYDNDVLLYTINNWTAQDNARTVTLTGLAFDTQHNIVARYMGNNKCSPSRSTIQTISVEDTRRATSTLTLQTGTKQFHYNTRYSDTIILTNTISEEFNQNRPIEIRYDGNLITTVTTNNEGKASFTIPDVGANGLHNISFHLEATRNLTTCDLSIDISVGYEVTITSYPKVMVKGGNYSVTANIKDYFGNLQDVENISNVKLHAISGQGTWVQNYYWNMNRISEGVYSITISITFSHLDIHTISVGLWNGDVKRYSSVDIPVNVISIASLTITSSTPQLYKNEENVVSIQSSSVVEGIPIKLTGAVEETVYTDSNGLATKTLIGSGIGSKTITASAGDKTASITLDDFIQYWSPRDVHNRDYQITNSSLDDLNNYFRVDVDYYSFIKLMGEPSLNYEYVIEGLTVLDLSRISIYPDEDEYNIYPYEIQLYKNDPVNIKVIKNNGTLSIYKNNNLLNSFSVDNFPYRPMFCFRNDVANIIQFTFKKLTYKRL